LLREYTKHEQNRKELGNLTVPLLGIPSSFSTGFILRNFTVKICRVSRLCFYSSKEKFKIIPDQNNVVRLSSERGSHVLPWMSDQLQREPLLEVITDCTGHSEFPYFLTLAYI
jgi:hypothetical protein